MKVVGYIRVSTSEQARDGFSLDAQRAAIEAECARRGWELVDVLADEGYSGKRDDRPALQQALSILRRKKARAIVVVRMDRLARSTQHLCEFILLSRRQKWGIVAMDFDFDTTTANGRLIARILASVAEWESEVNGERVREGMAEARAQREASGQPVTWGFKRQTPDLVVGRIVRARERGDSFNTIARRLQESQTPTPGNGARWYPSTVARIYKAATTETATTIDRSAS
ncbi:recombinase family protein [Nocardioides sp. QY071]|uniref:recombinase family protein n=1 Tax=Nocardioides sp. QY071 TaxID=3044187 RepID=UPI00249A798D|nr:recombinase family protein [Nocardioides sp. QY071]WGY04005.1 recombinase family protein [Nocardioides sp. QY071]